MTFSTNLSLTLHEEPNLDTAVFVNNQSDCLGWHLGYGVMMGSRGKLSRLILYNNSGSDHLHFRNCDEEITGKEALKEYRKLIKEKNLVGLVGK